MIVKRLIDKGFWFSKTNPTIKKTIELLIKATNGTLVTDNQQLEVIDYNVWLAVKALYSENEAVKRVEIELEQKEAAIDNDGFNIQFESTYNAAVEIERAKQAGNEKRADILEQFGYPAFYASATTDELESHIYDESDLINFLRSSEWSRKKGILYFENFSIEKDNSSKEFILKAENSIIARFDTLNEAIIEAGKAYYYINRKGNLEQAYLNKSAYYYPEKKSHIETMTNNPQNIFALDQKKRQEKIDLGMTDNEIDFNQVLKSINPNDLTNYSYFIEGNIIGGSLMYNPVTMKFGRYKYVGTANITDLSTFEELTPREETELYEDVRRGMVKIIRRGKKYPLNEKDKVLLNIQPKSITNKQATKTATNLFSDNVILPLLNESNPKGNTILKELRLNKIPYARAIDIISSVGALNTENVFVRDILNYGKREFAELDIINNSKAYYLSQPYFDKFPAELKDEWYNNHFKSRIGEYITIARSATNDILTNKLNLRFEEAGVNKKIPTISIKKKLSRLKDIINLAIIKQERPKQVEKEANENISNEKHQQFVFKMLEHIENKTKFSNKTQVEKIGKEYGITEPYKVKELVEFALVRYARKLAHQNQKTDKQKFFDIVNMYETQVNLTHRTNISIQLQQYSTPATIGYLMGVYCEMYKDGLYFEPSAGNGLLTIAAKESNFIVNEIDIFRFSNLSKQGYKEVLNKDATNPFPEYEKKFDAIITNPPFGTAQSVLKVNDYPIKSLEQQMVIRALDCLKDNGKAAFIIGGHLEYDEDGRIKYGKNSIFFNWLWQHYIVEDVINIDGYNLYRRQGTSYDTRVVLIGGRQIKPREDYFPILNKNLSTTIPFSKEPIKSFENLYLRFSSHF
jgi:hypothetical protein